MISFEERASDSPYIESITRGYTASDGSTIRPSEINWHLVITQVNGKTLPIVVGPWSKSGLVSWGGGAEILWIKFKLGTFMPHLPTRDFLDSEIVLPGASCNSFWLNSTTWQFPDYNNVETFIEHLVHDDMLVRDTMVKDVLEGYSSDLSSRTLRHRFLRSTGLTQSHIYQYERAMQAASLLEQGVSILDTVFESGYFDQPHLTRSLKQFLGFTPAQHIAQLCQPD